MRRIRTEHRGDRANEPGLFQYLFRTRVEVPLAPDRVCESLDFGLQSLLEFTLRFHDLPLGAIDGDSGQGRVGHRVRAERHAVLLHLSHFLPAQHQPCRGFRFLDAQFFLELADSLVALVGPE